MATPTPSLNELSNVSPDVTYIPSLVSFGVCSGSKAPLCVETMKKKNPSRFNTTFELLVLLHIFAVHSIY